MAATSPNSSGESDPGRPAGVDRRRDGILWTVLGVVLLVWTAIDVIIGFWEEEWYLNVFFALIGIASMAYGLYLHRSRKPPSTGDSSPS